jgi:serine/threonine-protein kinase
VEGLDFGRLLDAFADAKISCNWALVAAIGVEALRGLGAAHGRLDARGQPSPVIHRDVAPGNILLGTDGTVKLTDFGLARAMDRLQMTHPDVIKGKLQYLAPEITFGQKATVRSDLFSLGAVLWEAMTGRPLYRGSSDAEVFLCARQAKIPSLSKFRRDLPSPFVKIVDRSLAKDPAERFASAKEMLRSLSQILVQAPEPMDAYAIAETVNHALQLISGKNTKDEGPPPPVNGKLNNGKNKYGRG